MRYTLNNKAFARMAGATIAALIAPPAFAAGAPQPSSLSNSLALTLVTVAAVLLVVIGLLAYVLIGAAGYHLQKNKSVAAKSTALAAALLLSNALWAQDGPAPADAAAHFGGLGAFTFYTLVAVVGLELLVILVMLWFVKGFVAKEKAAAQVAPVATPSFKIQAWWNKINRFRPLQQEEDMMLHHDYDGIRELDNRLPPWWLYGFYLTIVFAGIYLFRYHVAHSAPLPAEELSIAMVHAEAQKEEYLRSAAGKVDENTVAMLTTPDDLAEGKNLFTSMCAACHGAEGQGGVGPNLTDDYWLHNGSIKDVFKTIKYGVPEKGMRSWKDDFSPVQIARIASYIKSLHGSHPANAKEPQGSLYSDDDLGAPADSLSVAAAAITAGK